MGTYTNIAAGRVKRTVGKATRNRSLQARGAAQETVGRVQRGARRAGRALQRGVGRAQGRLEARRPRRRILGRAGTRSRY